MVGVLSLQRAHQEFELRQPVQTLQTRIFSEKRPTRESSADTALKPFKGGFVSSRQGENASDLIIGMVSVAKGFWNRASLAHTFECLFTSACQCVQDPLQAYDERFVGQHSERFIE